MERSVLGASSDPWVLFCSSWYVVARKEQNGLAPQCSQALSGAREHCQALFSFRWHTLDMRLWLELRGCLVGWVLFIKRHSHFTEEEAMAKHFGCKSRGCWS